ncbi:MAG: hypothetical protein Fur0016_01210 [Anaerolineales bacterium]
MTELETKFIQGGCREVLKTIPNHSIDLVFTSHPYEVQPAMPLLMEQKGEYHGSNE